MGITVEEAWHYNCGGEVVFRFSETREHPDKKSLDDCFIHSIGLVNGKAYRVVDISFFCNLIFGVAKKRCANFEIRLDEKTKERKWLTCHFFMKK